MGLDSLLDELSSPIDDVDEGNYPIYSLLVCQLALLQMRLYLSLLILLDQKRFFCSVKIDRTHKISALWTPMPPPLLFLLEDTPKSPSLSRLVSFIPLSRLAQQVLYCGV